MVATRTARSAIFWNQAEVLRPVSPPFSSSVHLSKTSNGDFQGSGLECTDTHKVGETKPMLFQCMRGGNTQHNSAITPPSKHNTNTHFRRRAGEATVPLLTCSCCPGGPRLVPGADPLQLAFPRRLSDEPLQPVSKEGRVKVLPDTPQHFLQPQNNREQDNTGQRQFPNRKNDWVTL